MSDLGFEVESSNFTNYQGLVIEARFSINEHNGNPELVLKMRTDNAKLPEYTERYSLGTTTNSGLWVIVDDGARVQASDSSTKFRENSNYGKWISAAVKTAQINPGTGQSPDGRKWAGTRESSTWLGTKWLMKEVKSSFTNRETQEKVELRRNFPDQYLGWEAVAPGTPASTNQGVGHSNGASATTNARPLTDFAEALSDITAEHLATMINLAQQHPINKWRDEVMDQLPEVLGNSILLMEIARTDGLYESLRSQVATSR